MSTPSALEALKEKDHGSLKIGRSYAKVVSLDRIGGSTTTL